MNSFVGIDNETIDSNFPELNVNRINQNTLNMKKNKRKQNGLKKTNSSSNNIDNTIDNNSIDFGVNIGQENGENGTSENWRYLTTNDLIPDIEKIDLMNSSCAELSDNSSDSCEEKDFEKHFYTEKEEEKEEEIDLMNETSSISSIDDNKDKISVSSSTNDFFVDDDNLENKTAKNKKIKLMHDNESIKSNEISNISLESIKSNSSTISDIEPCLLNFKLPLTKDNLGEKKNKKRPYSKFEEFKKCFIDEKKKKRKLKHTDSMCVGCTLGSITADATRGTIVNKMLELMNAKYGQIPNSMLARQIHEFYKNEIYNVMKLKGKKIKIWRTFEIKEHLENHSNEPRIFIGEMLKTLKNELRSINNMCFKEIESSELGKKLVLDINNIKMRNEILKHIYILYKTDPKQLNFYNENTNIDFSKNGAFFKV